MAVKSSGGARGRTLRSKAGRTTWATGGRIACSQLVALKAVPGSLAAWDELSRVIPDHTFLTEVRVAGGTITLSGVSSDAARLVRILDGSRLFTGATLVGPITPDANERRDRFRMSLKLRKAGAGRVAKSAERPES